MGKLTTKQFRFRKQDQIGNADAEHDEAFLADCFVDAGDLEVLADCSDPRRIILGRTGTGKTALLIKLASNHEHVVEIKPEQLALAFLSNDSILPHMLELGVDLDLFFRLLWRHVFAVELIKERYRIKNEEEKRSFLSSMLARFSTNKKWERALQYLNAWGATFWEATEYRVREIATKLENDFKGQLGTQLGAKFAGIKSDSSWRDRFTQEEKKELCEQAQNVVNRIQIRELFEIVDLLRDELLDDPQYRIFLAIDRLDENWVSDRLRYRIIRALIETIREFLKVRNCKVIIALRQDLIERVIQETRDAGFQEEKYTDLYLNLKWSSNHLLEILDLRIDKLIREKYTKRRVDHREILPDHIDGMPIDEFLVKRTHHRPRDIILFFNRCIECSVEQSGGNPLMTVSLLKEADVRHSRDRLRSLGDEWTSVFPRLLDTIDLLKKRPARFPLGQIDTQKFEELALRLCTSADNQDSTIERRARDVVEGSATARAFGAYVARVWFQVGLVGVKGETFERTIWAFQGRELLASTEVGDQTVIEIHPMFWWILGTNPDRGR